MELFEDRVQPCHLKVFKRQAFGWLSTGLAEKHQVQNFKLPGSASGL